MSEKQQRKRRSGPIKRLALVFVSLVVSLLAVEGLLRWIQPGTYEPAAIFTDDGVKVPLQEIVHILRHQGQQDRHIKGPHGRLQRNVKWRSGYDRPRWDYFDEQGCISLNTNSLGFRDLEFSLEKPASEFRVLTLGDSFTYGQGVQLEDTWVQVLEGMLAEHRGKPVEVMNGGFATGGHYPPLYVDWLRTDGLAFSPDLVIVGFCLNDMSMKVPLLGYLKPTPTPWWGGHSMLLNWIQLEIEQRKEKAVKRDYADVVAEDPEWWEQSQAALIEMRALLAEREISLVVAVFPMMSQLGDEYPYLRLHEMVRAFCADNDIFCTDSLPRFRGMDEEDLWVHPVDQHPNHVGQRIIAEDLHEFLVREKLVQ